MVRFISKHILTGLVTILPVVLTLYLLYWFAVSAESMLGDMIRLWLPENRYWPGMGVIAGLVAVFIVGLLMHAYVVQRLFAKGEKLLSRTPVIKSIYLGLARLPELFFAGHQEGIRAGGGSNAWG